MARPAGWGYSARMFDFDRVSYLRWVRGLAARRPAKIPLTFSGMLELTAELWFMPTLDLDNNSGGQVLLDGRDEIPDGFRVGDNL